MEEYYNKEIYNIADLKFAKNSFILLASKRRSGKSVLCKDILLNIINNDDISFVVLFSQTSKLNEDYDFIPEKFRFKHDQMETEIQNIISFQEKKILEYKKKKKNKKKQIHGIIILDDIKINSRSNELIYMATMARHYNIAVILSVQFPKKIVDTSIRSNLDYCFVNELSYEGMEAIHKSIQIPYSLKEFRSYIYNNNDDYQFIMFDGLSKKKERIKLVKSKLIKNLKFI